MDIITGIAILGSFASIIGLIIAWIQTVRLRKLKRQKNADTWLAIRETLSIIRGLKSPGLPDNIKKNGIISTEYGRLHSLHRQLLKTAILDEKKFSELTIKAWIKVGKLEEEWQENEARKFLLTEEIAVKMDKKIRERVLSNHNELNPPINYKDLKKLYRDGKIDLDDFNDRSAPH